MEDYQIRFIKEYEELKKKTEKLSVMVYKYKYGALNFTPTCSLELLNSQLQCMHAYLSILEERARIEGVDLLKHCPESDKSL